MRPTEAAAIRPAFFLGLCRAEAPLLPVEKDGKANGNSAKHERHPMGLLAMLGSALLFAIMALLVKVLNQFGTFELVFWRSLFLLFGTMAMLAYKGTGGALSSRGIAAGASARGSIVAQGDARALLVVLLSRPSLQPARRHALTSRVAPNGHVAILPGRSRRQRAPSDTRSGQGKAVLRFPAGAISLAFFLALSLTRSVLLSPWWRHRLRRRHSSLASLPPCVLSRAVVCCRHGHATRRRGGQRRLRAAVDSDASSIRLRASLPHRSKALVVSKQKKCDFASLIRARDGWRRRVLSPASQPRPSSLTDRPSDYAV